MRFSPLLFALFFALTLGSGSAQANILVSIDKSTQSMTVARDGETLYRWPVSTGRRGYDTPNGNYRAFRMEADHFSKEWDDAPMPHSIFFTKIGHAIHGYLDTKNIGRPASHGCVRLKPENASTLYALVEEDGVLNTTVAISGQIPAEAPAVARRQDRTPAPSDAQRAPLPIVPDGEYTPQDQNYPRQYGGQQDWQRPSYGQPRDFDPRYPQPQIAQPRYPQPQYQYGHRTAQPRAIEPDDPRYGQRYDPRSADDNDDDDDDDDDAPAYVPPRRYDRPLFPFGGN